MRGRCWGQFGNGAPPAAHVRALLGAGSATASTQHSETALARNPPPPTLNA